MLEVCYDLELIMEQFTNKIIVIKVGTSTLTKTNEKNQYELDADSFYRIGRQVISLQKAGYGVCIVSSAAITAGMSATSTYVRPSNDEQSMPTLQALASVGWRHVVNKWAHGLPGIIIGELLVTRHELEIELERSELLKVTHALMMKGYVPIINENDAITHEEIAFGDNNTLAATFASKLSYSELFGGDVSLVVLSDVDGVYKDVTMPETLVAEVSNIDELRHVAGGSASNVGTGGMATKFAAATIATKSGVDMYIVNGRVEAIIESAINRESGTYFKAVEVS